MGNYFYFNLIPAVDKSNGHPWVWKYDNGELVSLTVPYFRITWTINDERKG